MVAEVRCHLSDYHDTRIIFVGFSRALSASTRERTPTISSNLWVGIMLYRASVTGIHSPARRGPTIRALRRSPQCCTNGTAPGMGPATLFQMMEKIKTWYLISKRRAIYSDRSHKNMLKPKWCYRRNENRFKSALVLAEGCLVVARP